MLELKSVYKVPDAVGILYELLKERSSDDINISHRNLPSRADHVTFFESRPYRFWYLIMADGIAVGACYITKLNEIGIFVFRAHRGKGYGFNAVAMLTQKHKPLPAIPGRRSGEFLANIHPNNERSIRLFTKLGMTRRQITMAL